MESINLEDILISSNNDTFIIKPIKNEEEFNNIYVQLQSIFNPFICVINSGSGEIREYKIEDYLNEKTNINLNYIIDAFKNNNIYLKKNVTATSKILDLIFLGYGIDVIIIDTTNKQTHTFNINSYIDKTPYKELNLNFMIT